MGSNSSSSSTRRNTDAQRAREHAEAEAEAGVEAPPARVSPVKMQRPRMPTEPCECRGGVLLMITAEEKQKIDKYVPNHKQMPAEEVRSLLPKLHLGQWMFGSAKLFQKPPPTGQALSNAVRKFKNSPKR